MCLVNKAVPDQSTTIRNLKGWADTVLWSPYGNDGMGYKNFACVESAKVCARNLNLNPKRRYGVQELCLRRERQGMCTKPKP